MFFLKKMKILKSGSFLGLKNDIDYQFQSIVRSNNIILLESLFKLEVFPKSSPLSSVTSHWQICRVILDYCRDYSCFLTTFSERIALNVLVLKKSARPILSSLKSLCADVLFRSRSWNQLKTLPPYLLSQFDEPLPYFSYLQFLDEPYKEEMLDLLNRLKKSNIPFNNGSFPVSGEVSFGSETIIVKRTDVVLFTIETSAGQFSIQWVTECYNGYDVDREATSGLQNISKFLEKVGIGRSFAFPFIALLLNYTKYHSSIGTLFFPSILNDILTNDNVPSWYIDASKRWRCHSRFNLK